MEMMTGEKWCKIEIYNEYLKKIPSLLCQINTVEKMQEKAEIELSMLESIPEDESKKTVSCSSAFYERSVPAASEGYV